MQTAALDAVLDEIVAGWDIPGMAVGIVQGEQIIYTKCSGVQSLDTGAPVTPDSLFCVASISKAFVATAVLQLVEGGLLDLDAPLVQALPGFRLDDPRSDQVTLRQMLSHTSGFPDMDESEYDELLSHPETDEQAPARYVRALSKRRLAAAPGERFLYSNIAYNVLGHLIATVLGQPFEACLKAHVLLPAGMPESTFLPGEIPPERLAVPHLRAPGMQVCPFYPYHRADAPASSLHASLAEMLRWASACLRQGRPPGAALLSPAGFERMWTPVVEWGYPPFYEHVGLGWTLGHYQGFKTASHGGMGYGWSTFLTLLPEKNLGAVILSNEESFARARSLRAVANAMLDLPPQVGSLSWMAPISRALAQGGLQQAQQVLTQIKDGPAEAYYIDPDDLLNLAYQLSLAGKRELSLGLLALNLQAFPEHVETLLHRARLLLQSGDRPAARQSALAALRLEPDNPAAAELLLRC